MIIHARYEEQWEEEKKKFHKGIIAKLLFARGSLTLKHPLQIYGMIDDQRKEECITSHSSPESSAHISQMINWYYFLAEQESLCSSMHNHWRSKLRLLLASKRFAKALEKKSTTASTTTPADQQLQLAKSLDQQTQSPHHSGARAPGA